MFASAAVLLVAMVSSAMSGDAQNQAINVAVKLPQGDDAPKSITLHASQEPGRSPQDPVKKSFGAGLELKADNGLVTNLGATHFMGTGTKVDVGASMPLHQSKNSQLTANVHDSRMLNTAQQNSVGGGLQFDHKNGLQSSVGFNKFMGGTRVDLGASMPLHQSDNSRLTANVHDSRMLNTAQQNSVGGGLQFNHVNGLHSSVGATHHYGLGNSYKADVGVDAMKLGGGTLSVGVGAAKNTWSPGVDKQVLGKWGRTF